MIVHNVYKGDTLLGRLKPLTEISAGIIKTFFLKDSEEPLEMEAETDRYNGIYIDGMLLGMLDVNYIEQHEPWKVVVKQQFDAEAEDYEYPGYQTWNTGV